MWDTIKFNNMYIWDFKRDMRNRKGQKEYVKK